MHWDCRQKEHRFRSAVLPDKDRVVPDCLTLDDGMCEPKQEDISSYAERMGRKVREQK